MRSHMSLRGPPGRVARAETEARALSGASRAAARAGSGAGTRSASGPLGHGNIRGKEQCRCGGDKKLHHHHFLWVKVATNNEKSKSFMAATAQSARLSPTSSTRLSIFTG